MTINDPATYPASVGDGITYTYTDSNGVVRRAKSNYVATKPKETPEEWTNYPDDYENEIALWEVNFKTKASREELVDLLESLTTMRELKFRKVGPS